MTEPNFAPTWWADTRPDHCPPCIKSWRCKQGRCEEPAAINDAFGGLLFMAALVVLGLAMFGCALPQILVQVREWVR